VTPTTEVLFARGDRSTFLVTRFVDFARQGEYLVNASASSAALCQIFFFPFFASLLASAYVWNRANELGEIALATSQTNPVFFYRLLWSFRSSKFEGEQSHTFGLPGSSGANVFIRSFSICPPVCMSLRSASRSHVSELFSQSVCVWTLYCSPDMYLPSWIRMGLVILLL
jgi:hypothetical protein